MIDVGGTALLSAAARNYAGVAAVAEPGRLRAGRRRDPGPRAASPPSSASAWPPRRSRSWPPTTPRSPPTSTRSPGPPSRPTSAIVLEKVADLRYGENPHQRAAFYRETTHRDGTLADATQLQGREPVVQRPARPRRRVADRRATSPPRRPSSCATPTRSGSPPTTTSSEAFRHALETDPAAVFGSIVGRQPRRRRADRARDRRGNRSRRVVAPGYTDEAAAASSRRGRSSSSSRCRRTRRTACATTGSPPSTSSGSAAGSSSRRSTATALDRGQLQVVTQRRPTLEELTDLLFAWRAAAHVRSNAIVLARNLQTVGIGGGQVSRQVAVEIALRRAGDRAKMAVMSSRRLLPVPRRHRPRGDRRRDRDHPAGRLAPRRDGDRGRRPAPPRDGLHRPAALPALSRGRRPAPATRGDPDPWNACSRSS